jgi:glycerophosphoryl diester phosphodiesterase
MKIMGHRGARNEFAENTLGSIQIALNAGISAIEIDIHLSKDNEMMVIHDDTLDRTTNGTGTVLSHTLNELKKLDAGKGQEIPTLAEVINLVRDKVLLFIEIKADNCEKKVVSLLESENYSNFIIKSFNHRYLKKIKELNSEIKTAALIHALPVDPAHMVKACGADMLSLSLHFLDKKVVELCHEEDLLVCSWNCNEIENLENIRMTGVDYLGTDLPTTICKES